MFPGPGTGGLSFPNDYSAQQSWQVTDSQVSSLWAGQWAVQFTFPNGIDTGAIVPVPEPSSVDLVFGGAGFIILIYVRKHLSLNHQSDKSEVATLAHN